MQECRRGRNRWCLPQASAPRPRSSSDSGSPCRVRLVGRATDGQHHYGRPDHDRTRRPTVRCGGERSGRGHARTRTVRGHDARRSHHTYRARPGVPLGRPPERLRRHTGGKHPASTRWGTRSRPPRRRGRSGDRDHGRNGGLRSGATLPCLGALVETPLHRHPKLVFASDDHRDASGKRSQLHLAQWRPARCEALRTVELHVDRASVLRPRGTSTSVRIIGEHGKCQLPCRRDR